MANINIGGRLHSTATGNVVTGADEVLYEPTGGTPKKQSDVNQETDAALADRYTKSETYNKTQVNQLVSPQHNYVVVETYADLANISEHPEGCVYRVSNYDGTNSQVDATMYSEYGWDGTQYIHLATKSQIGEVFDISAYRATGGTLAKYADLTAALGTGGANIPEAIRKGGMSVKFVHTSDNKYVQCRYMGTSTANADFANVANWQGVDKEPSGKGRNNLVESVGVYANLHYYAAPANAIYDSIFAAYEQGIYDCLVDKTVTYLSINAYEYTLYIKVNDETESLSLNNIKDFSKVHLHYNNDIVGYIMFRKVQNFKTNNYGGQAPLNIPFITNPALHTQEYIISRLDNIESNIDNIESNIEYQSSHFYTKDSLEGYYSEIVRNYESAISDIYIDKSLYNVTYLSLRSYSYYLYIAGKKDNEEEGTLSLSYSTSAIENFKKYDIIYNDIIIGYFIIRDISVFKKSANNLGNPGASLLDITNVTNNLLHNYNFNIPPLSIGTEELKNNSVTEDKMDFNWYSVENAANESYEQGLLDVYIDNAILDITDFSIRQYEWTIYVNYKISGDDSWKQLTTFNRSTVVNYAQYPLVVNELTVGYIIFKDKNKFNVNSGAANDNKLFVAKVTSKKGCYHSNSFYGTSNEVGKIIHNNLSIILPSTIYAIVGTQLNIWNDTVSYCINKGLQTPLNYTVSWGCAVGMGIDRCYRFTPDESHAGHNYSLTCSLFDMFGNFVISKTVTIKVLAKDALVTSKRIVFFGDSTGGTTASALYEDFHNNDRYAGTIPNMVGSRGGTSVRYEAVGGYGWSDYATQGRAAFRCYIENGAPTIPLNAKYTNNGFTWEVVEVNITDGSGNILITKDSTTYTDHPTPSGTLVAVTSGVSDINYDSYTNAPANPLWDETLNDGAGGLSIEHYKSVLGLSNTDKLDAVSFFLGLNGGSASNEIIKGYIKSLYDLFVNDNPNCKVIIGIVTASNTEYGWGLNYGASIPSKNFVDMLYKVNSLYLSLLSDSNFPNLRICPAGNEIDRYYGYMFTTKQISQRYTENETVHSNAVHPGSSGYAQFGDAFFASYIGVLTE